MVLNSSGAISIGGSTTGESINLELGLSGTANTSLNDGRFRALAAKTSGAIDLDDFYGKRTPQYWWSASYGLSTSSWTAITGGLNFTLYNVSSANSSTGVYFNGTSGYGLTGNAGSTIDAKHVFIRSDSIPGTASQAILGGSQHNIHEWYFTNTTDNWYIVERLASGLTYAAQNGALGSTLTWTDLVNYAAPRYFTNTNTSGTNLTVYFGTYPNRLRWESGYGIYVGRRHEGNYMTGYIKEIAIFTDSLTDAQAKAFRTDMYTRWP